MYFDGMIDVFYSTVVLTMMIFLLIMLVLKFLLEKCESASKVIVFSSVIFSLITIVVLTFLIIYYNYTLPKFHHQQKIEYRDSQLSKLSKGELDCNLIYTDEDIYFELSLEEQQQYYTKCKVIQESK